MRGVIEKVHCAKPFFSRVSTCVSVRPCINVHQNILKFMNLKLNEKVITDGQANKQA